MRFDYIYFDSGGTIYGLFDGDDPSPSDIAQSGLARVEALLLAFGYQYDLTNAHAPLDEARQYCESTYGSMKYTFYQQLIRFFDQLKIELPNEVIVCLSDALAGPRFASWIFPGTLQAFKDFNAAGIGLGIIANTVWSSYNMDRAFEGVGLLPYLSHRVYSGNVNCAKPEMDIFSYAEQLAQVQDKRVLYVGNDIEKDVKASKQFGWSAAFRCSDSEPSSQGLADFDFNHIQDLTQYVLQE